VLVAAALHVPFGAVRGAEKWNADICEVAMHEKRIEREDLELEVDLARSDFEAYEQIYSLIDGLWKADAIERMTWLRAKYDYESAKLHLEQAGLVVKRQKALERQLALICGVAPAKEGSEPRARAIEQVGEAYLRAHCDALAHAAEAARVSLEFNRQFLASVLDLREGQVATRQDVILAELDVAREEKRLADALRRAEACRKELGPVEGESAPPTPAGER